MVDEENPDIIVTPETWLTSEVFDNETHSIGFLSSRAALEARKTWLCRTFAKMA